MVCRSMSASLSGCVSGSCACCSLVEVGAQASDDAGSDVLAELVFAAVEVAGRAPCDLGCAFTFGPVAHEPFGGVGVAVDHWRFLPCLVPEASCAQQQHDLVLAAHAFDLFAYGWAVAVVVAALGLVVVRHNMTPQG